MEATTYRELAQSNKSKLEGSRDQFRQTFGEPLHRFWHPLFGFDIVAFDAWIGPPDGISLHDHLLSTKGQSTVTFIEELINSLGS